MSNNLEWNEKGRRERVLFVRYSAFGDIVRALPLARRIRQVYPEAHMTWLVARPNEILVSSQPYVDDVIVWDRARDNRAFFEVIRKVRRGGFTRLVVRQSTDRMALLSLSSGIPWRCGSRFRSRFIFEASLDKFAATLGPIDRVGALCVDESIRREMASKLLPLGDKILAAAIGASKIHKQWPVSNWVDLIRRAGEAGWGICLLGYGAEEEDKARAIVSGAETDRIVNLVGQTDLPHSIAAVQLSRALVAGDTGLLHVAMGSGIPAIGLFGPTLPEQGGLEGVDRKLFVSCPERGCNRWDCPRTDCLGSIGADDVFRELVSADKTR